jgi:hypothetical protein
MPSQSHKRGSRPTGSSPGVSGRSLCPLTGRDGRGSLWVLTVSYKGVTEHVMTSEDKTLLLDKVTRWEPDVRLGRVAWQDYGYKEAVMIRDGIRTYELFQAAEVRR